MSKPLGEKGIDAAMKIIGKETGDDQTMELISGTIDVFRDRVDDFTTEVNPQFRISDYRLFSDLYRHIYLYGINIGIALYDRAVSEGIDVIALLRNLYDDE